MEAYENAYPHPCRPDRHNNFDIVRFKQGRDNHNNDDQHDHRPSTRDGPAFAAELRTRRHVSICHRAECYNCVTLKLALATTIHHS